MRKPEPLSISIAMATYNGAKYIREQLDDLAAQSQLPAELVICDDQSSDDTLALVANFAETAPFPVQVHRNPERLGYRANFMKTAGLCGSDLIAFCDQDDRWRPRKLELLAKCFSDDGVLLAYHNARPVIGEGRSLPLLYRERANSRLEPLSADPWFNPLGFTQIFRRSLLGFVDLWILSSDQNHEGERLAHDQWYFLLASALGSIVYLSDVLADYRQHEANTFGVSRYGLLAPRLTELWHATHDRKRRLDAAKGRAVIFRQLSERVSGQLHERSSEAASWYDRLADLVCIRSHLYDAPNLVGRASTLRRLVRANAYGSKPPFFSPITLASDATVGLLGVFPLLESFAQRRARR
jgi:glycosyltransferase involved in cell wall biosynthesis